MKQTLKSCLNLTLVYLLLHLPIFSYSQAKEFQAAKGEIDFTDQLRVWDGFGFNYVETAQTYDYENNPQDYGGFSFLDESQKHEIIELVFGDNGLRPSIVKMFLDPLHQTKEGGAYNHKQTTSNMRYFVKEGIKLSQIRNEEIQLISTLYAPPAYITKQNVMRGRDLDPSQIDNLIHYMVDWVDFLKNEENLPIKFISIHNEGESWLRWPQDGTTGGALDEGHDYNLFWNPEQTTKVINKMRPMMDAKGLQDIGITNGEYTNWYRFYHWGFAKELVNDKSVLDNVGLVTSHGFYVGPMQSGRWHGPHSNLGIDLVREKKPEMHAWVTSTAWNIFERVGDERTAIMDAHFVKEIHGNIYEAKVNAIIPWAGIQTHTEWWKPDPNPGTAIRVYKDGTYEIPKAYYYYKQLTMAGRPNMAVVYTAAMDSEFSLIGFSKNKSDNPNAFVITHTGKQDREIELSLKGTGNTFKAYRTSGSQTYSQKESAGLKEPTGENHIEIGEFKLQDGKLSYKAPAGSVTTFIEK